MPETDTTEQVLVSYAHADNKPAVKGQDGWVKAFHYALMSRVHF